MSGVFAKMYRDQMSHVPWISSMDGAQILISSNDKRVLMHWGLNLMCFFAPATCMTVSARREVAKKYCLCKGMLLVDPFLKEGLRLRKDCIKVEWTESNLAFAFFFAYFQGEVQTPTFVEPKPTFRPNIFARVSLLGRSVLSRASRHDSLAHVVFSSLGLHIL